MPPRPEIIPQKNYRRATWKNGLGWTDEIAIHPPEADLRRGDFLWRVSSAHVEKAAPFSVFPEHDRVLVILEGEGVTLSHTFVEGEPSEITEVPPLQPYEFPGDVPTHCEPLGGGFQDLSVFLRKGEIFVNAEVIEIDEEEPIEWFPQGRWNFLFLVEGKAQVAGGGTLDARDSLRVDLQEGSESEPLEIRSLTERSVAVQIQIDG